MTKPSKNQDGSVRWRPSSHEKIPPHVVLWFSHKFNKTHYCWRILHVSVYPRVEPRSVMVGERATSPRCTARHPHPLTVMCFVTWCLRRTFLRRRVDMPSPNLFFGGCFAVEGLRPLQISLVVLDFFTLFLCVILWGSDASSLCGARRIIAACREYCPSQDVFLLSPWRLGTAGRP